MAYAVRALDASSWETFAELVEANDGVWGGCWCMGFHVPLDKRRTAQQNREEKRQRVMDGTAHAALVIEEGRCVGWAQFGSCSDFPS